MNQSKTRTSRAIPVAVLVACCLLLAACASGPVRRVSEPAASIQQLTVAANGDWSLELRINNYSSVPMRFDTVALAVTVDGQPAGTLQGQPGISIGPESADVVDLQMTPSAIVRLHVADALAERRSIAYTLKGRVDATPEDGGQRSFDIDRDSALSPMPGLPGVLR